MSRSVPSIVAYDVSDDRRRGRVADHLSSIGVRLQRSVFEVLASDHDRLAERLAVLLGPSDRLEIIDQCLSCEAGRRRIGVGASVLRDGWWEA